MNILNFLLMNYRNKKLLIQIIKFGIVGIVAFSIDYLTLYVLVEYFNINYLFSSAISFVLSVICNYILSMKFVFVRRDEMSRKKEFVIFVVLSIIGLVINELFMWIMVDNFNIFYMISKVITTILVMVWNFITRKIFLE